ncbi:hypothetical protein Godav_011644 [Gossypium davidsonii]|uniref:Uncharacterized protein n=1 Tax=Gossypium davidsonii TaxID=34287 RepID=A0A7J8RC00_GOSDV|nr:hypothetical protein [Gossypium davidsonii]
MAILVQSDLKTIVTGKSLRI